MKINKKSIGVKTHEGGSAIKNSAYADLRKAVLTSLLWEDSFYESGADRAQRISDLVSKVEYSKLVDLAIEAKTKFKLRHVPIYLALLTIRKGLRGEAAKSLINAIITRADELTEIVSIYRLINGNKKALPNSLKKGIALAFGKFTEYHFSRNRAMDKSIKLRDVLRMCHPKPIDDERASLYSRINNDTLQTPLTWQVELSSGKNKKEVWENLIDGKALGGLDILRNLRNMEQANVDRKKIRNAILNGKYGNALPFQFIAAAKASASQEPYIEQAMLKSITFSDGELLKGRTILLIDVSGSMSTLMSRKSVLDRLDSCKAIAILLREVCEDVRILKFSHNVVEVPARRGFALSSSIGNSSGPTDIRLAVKKANSLGYDRLIVLTDEQSSTDVPSPLSGTVAYMVDVAGYANTVGEGKWTRISGFSEQIVSYISASEREA